MSNRSRGTKQNEQQEVIVHPTRLLFLSLVAADDLAVSLRGALQGDPSFDFDLREKVLGTDELASPSRIPAGAFSHWRPQIGVFCLPQGRREEAEAFFGVMQRHLEGVPIVIATGTNDSWDLCRWLELGAADFLIPPFSPAGVLPRLWRLRNQTTTDDLVVQLKERIGLKQLVGESPALLTEMKKIPVVARSEATVLIAGETGTGKEMFARAIHHLSRRSAKSFVGVNCGAIPVDLVENELFGHEPGAFTGASSSAVGLLKTADGGSLFLDEVDCLPLLAQMKLLRFLQDKEFRPLGANKTCHVDVRVIAASNSNLEQAVKQGRFRQDLYYRLNVIRLALPPLRDRKEDVRLLAQHFVRKHAAAYNAPVKDISNAALQKLMLYDWPGNVRELENVIERSVVLSSQSLLRAEDIELPSSVAGGPDERFQTMKARIISQFECAYIQDLLRAHNGNISKAAKAAGKHRRAFWELIRKHRIIVQPPSALASMTSSQ